MKFFTKIIDPAKAEVNLLVMFAETGKTSQDTIVGEEIKKIDALLSGEISEIAGLEKFEATPSNSILLTTHKAIIAPRALVIGIGKRKELRMSDWLSVAASISRKVKQIKGARVGVVFPEALLESFGTYKTAQGFAEGFTLGAYEFLKHKSKEEKNKHHVIEEIQFLVSPYHEKDVLEGSQRGVAISGGAALARDLVNEPPSICTPTYVASQAEQLAKNHPEIKCEVLGRQEMEKLGMGGLLGIARGSDEEPKFIKLTYQGGSKKTIALVGKGITFDTGGLSLKPPQSMETMKLDMAGAAAILGLFSVLTECKPKINVVGLLCMTENMPSGKAVKPGDVVQIMNGKTVEILNTDAEGRMVLSDGLSYAVEKVKADIIIDVATLTGACMIALGEDIAGLFTNDRALAKSLSEAAESSGERIWELPLAKEYKDRIKSAVADIKNISKSRMGGAINGALFLQEFVPDTTPWAHIDIAGPAFAESDRPLTPVGGTGFGVSLMLSYLMSL